MHRKLHMCHFSKAPTQNVGVRCPRPLAGPLPRSLQDTLHVHHALFPQVERLLQPVDLLVVALHDHLRAGLVILRRDLDCDLVRPLRVVEVVLARDGGDEGGEVPVVPQPVALAEDALLEDAQHQRQRAERDEHAEGQEGGASRDRRLHALEGDHVARVLDLVVVRLEEADDVARQLARRPAAIAPWSQHLVHLAHDLGLDGAGDERVDAREREHVQGECGVVGRRREGADLRHSARNLLGKRRQRRGRQRQCPRGRGEIGRLRDRGEGRRARQLRQLRRHSQREAACWQR
mmetsp:Transcript_24766/g.59116  ORF Transcript_24766/g.59116 Transcript_24766/m.59116 type:complete len:291 (+) Transcript_24766:106-978(+)